jgi:hypothetical protein
MPDRNVASFLVASHMNVARHCRLLLAREGLTDADARRLRNLLAAAEMELEQLRPRSEAAKAA